MLFFYADIFVISAAVGIMFLITRIWDALNDPTMGVVCDRPETRWGKFRPCLLLGAAPFAIIGIITFSTSVFSPSGKLIDAYVTFTLMMIYTVVNVPYSSLMRVMTNNPSERTSFASFRFAGAFSNDIFVTVTAAYLVEYFGGKVNPAQGYQLIVSIYALFVIIFFLLTSSATKELLKPAKVKHSSVKDDLKDISKNGTWFIMLASFGFQTNVKHTLQSLVGTRFIISVFSGPGALLAA